MVLIYARIIIHRESYIYIYSRAVYYKEYIASAWQQEDKLQVDVLSKITVVVGVQYSVLAVDSDYHCHVSQYLNEKYIRRIKT